MGCRFLGFVSTISIVTVAYSALTAAVRGNTRWVSHLPRASMDAPGKDWRWLGCPTDNWFALQNIMATLLKLRLGVSDDPTAFQPSLNDCLEAMLQQSDVLVNDMLKGLVAACAPANARRLPAFQLPAVKAAVDALSVNAKA